MVLLTINSLINRFNSFSSKKTLIKMSKNKEERKNQEKLLKENRIIKS